MPNSFSKYVAEFLGTFALVFIGGAAVALNIAAQGAVTLLGVAFAHGLVLASMIYALGHISGGHFNPAVTVSMLLTRKIKIFDGVSYIISQLLGAMLAGYLITLVFVFLPVEAKFGALQISPAIGQNVGILLEAVLTFFLVLTIFGVAVDKRGMNPFGAAAIGLVLTVGVLIGGLLTGGALNPARSFGIAFAANFWDNQIVYWIGPIVGALIAALVYEFVFMNKEIKLGRYVKPRRK